MGSQRVGHDWVTELNWTESSSKKEQPGLSLGITERQLDWQKAWAHLWLWQLCDLLTFSNSLGLSFFFSFKFIFSWRIVNLQYCGDFCRASTWLSHKHPNVTPLHLPSHRLSSHLGVTEHHLCVPCVTASSLWPSPLHVEMCRCQRYSLASSRPLLPPPCAVSPLLPCKSAPSF